MNLIEALDKSTEKDLEDIQKQITFTEDKLRSLKRVEKILLSKFGKVEKKKLDPGAGAGARAGSYDIYEVRRRVAKFLSDGPQNGQQIMIHCKIGGPKFTEVMGYEWFLKVQNGYQLTSLGRKYGVEESE